MSASVQPPAVLRLREQIQRLEGVPPRARSVLPFGIETIDSRLPGGGLVLGALHEVAGGGNAAIDGAAAALFAAGIAARTKGRILWCITRRDLFAPALAQVGLAADRVIYVDACDEKSVLACFEEGIRHGGLVVAEVARLSMTSSRRLSLAAEASGSIAIAVRRWRRQTEAADFGQPTASATGWRVSTLPSAALPVPGVGRARWLLELIRCRAGESADFVVGRGMSRVVSLYLPTWPTDRLRRKMGAAAPDGARPLVLVGQVGRRRDVVAANAIAIQAGLRVGMPATRAQALVNELVIQPADPAADAEALERLAIWALRYSPIVVADNPDGLIIDATGTSHLHGGLTPADAPLIDAEKLFREPGPPHREGVLGYLGRAGRARKKRTAYGPE